MLFKTEQEYFDLYRAYIYAVYITNSQSDFKDSIVLGGVDIKIETIFYLVESWKTENPQLYDKISRLFSSLKAKKHRCNNRIRFMLDKDIENCYFITFTFDNETLSNLNADSRRQYVRRYLNKYFSDYVANIDYGSINEREHYHAIGILNDSMELIPTKRKGVYNLLHYAKGHTTALNVRSQDDYIKLSAYINKFTNHAFKDSTKANKLIYSRSFTKDIDNKIKLLEYEYENISLSSNAITAINEYVKRRKNKLNEINYLKNKCGKGC